MDQAFNRLTTAGEASVLRDLCECEAIELQMGTARSRMKFTKIAKVEVNHSETAMLRGELTYWVLRLASDLGVVENPYAAMTYQQGMGGGINARVVS